MCAGVLDCLVCTAASEGIEGGEHDLVKVLISSLLDFERIAVNISRSTEGYELSTVY